MTVKAEGTFSSLQENGFWNQKLLPDPCSFLVIAKPDLALLASSIAASLLLLFAVTSFMSVVLQLNSKSSRENFGVILWDLKRIFFLFYIPLLPVKKFWCTILSLQRIITYIYRALLSRLSAFADVHIVEGGGSGKITAPDMTPGRGVSYILPLKVFFYAMPFPARQQGGLTGDYVSLPGYTETKQRVRQDHPPLTPCPPSPATPTPPTDSLSLCFDTLKIPKFHCCVQKFWPLFLNFISVDSARIPWLPWSSFLCFLYTFHCLPPTLSHLFHFFFPSIKNFKCTHPKNNTKWKKKTNPFYSISGVRIFLKSLS